MLKCIVQHRDVRAARRRLVHTGNTISVGDNPYIRIQQRVHTRLVAAVPSHDEGRMRAAILQFRRHPGRHRGLPRTAGSQVADGLPIKGWGAATYVVALGWVNDLMDPFPFWIFELLFAVPLTVALLVRQWRGNSLPATFAHYGIASFVILYFSRTMNPNYLGFLLAMLAIGFFADEPQIETAA